MVLLVIYLILEEKEGYKLDKIFFLCYIELLCWCDKCAPSWKFTTVQFVLQRALSNPAEAKMNRFLFYVLIFLLILGAAVCADIVIVAISILGGFEGRWFVEYAQKGVYFLPGAWIGASLVAHYFTPPVQ